MDFTQSNANCIKLATQSYQEVPDGAPGVFQTQAPPNAAYSVKRGDCSQIYTIDYVCIHALKYRSNHALNECVRKNIVKILLCRLKMCLQLHGCAVRWKKGIIL